MHAVFLDKQTFNASIDMSEVKNQVKDLVCYNITSENNIIARSLEADIIITNKVPLTKKVLAALPKLKLVCITATGFNNIDIDAAKQLGIAVCNVSGYAGQSVGQYVFSQLLNYFQQITHHNANTKKGLWSMSEAFCYHGNTIHELAGKTLGIIGYGNLGKKVSNIAQAFDMKVLISERPKVNKIRAGRVAFDQLISQSDIISLHCPHTLETEHLINAEVFNCMKNSAVLVNTARGALVDEKALLKALQDEQIACAILDVLQQEPPSKNHPLLIKPLANLKLTAHIAWASIEAQQRLILLLAQNIQAFKQNSLLNRII
jgi:glycerate dehydrogenase